MHAFIVRLVFIVHRRRDLLRRGRRSAESHAASAGAARGGDLELVDIGEEDGEVMVGRGRGRRRFRRRRSCVCTRFVAGVWREVFNINVEAHVEVEIYIPGVPF